MKHGDFNMTILNKRVVARFRNRTSQNRFDGKFLGDNARLRWNRNGWLLEELPQKGKKKLRKATFDDFSTRGWQGFSAYIPGNVLREANLNASDDYDKIKQKMTDTFALAAEKTIAGMPPEMIEKNPNHWAWLRDPKWSEYTVYFLEVEPEDTEPFTAEAKDFSVKVSWHDFTAYSPTSDLAQADPHYTMYSASAPAAARKLYQILKADPKGIKDIPWAKFDDFLKKNKVGYKINFSVWH